MRLPKTSWTLRFSGSLLLIAIVALVRLLQSGEGNGGSSPGRNANQSVSSRIAHERPAGTAHDPLRAQIVNVVDGDTVDARLADGYVQRVRLIGIDTPEKYALRTGSVECGGTDASAVTRGLAKRWPAVTLRPDRTQDAYDKYGRLLAYVEPDAQRSTTYQQAILAQGWAKVYVFGGHPFERVRDFRASAAQAQRASTGVWRKCGGDFRKPIS